MALGASPGFRFRQSLVRPEVSAGGSLRLLKSTPFGLVPLVKKISWLEKCDLKRTHFLQTAARGGGLEEMGSLGL